jgi:hypothetical protein
VVTRTAELPEAPLDNVHVNVKVKMEPGGMALDAISIVANVLAPTTGAALGSKAMDE